MFEFFVSLAGLVTTKLISAVFYAVILLIGGKYILLWLEKRIGKLRVEPTLHKFLFAVARVLLYFVAIMIVASSLGFEMSSLVALASVVSAAFALAASGVLSNIFGGLLLLITKPFAVGDYVSICGNDGTVLELGILATKINTVDNKRIVVPNSSISSATIVNYSTEGKRRVDLVFSVGYDSKIEDVKNAVIAAAGAHEKVLDKENIFVRISAYNDYSIAYTVRVWCKTADYWDVYFDLLEQVKVEFDNRNVKMVFPTVNIVSVKE